MSEPAEQPFAQNIFELQCILQNINIRLCARIESGVKQLLAIITRYTNCLMVVIVSNCCFVVMERLYCTTLMVKWFQLLKEFLGFLIGIR